MHRSVCGKRGKTERKSKFREGEAGRRADLGNGPYGVGLALVSWLLPIA